MAAVSQSRTTFGNNVSSVALAYSANVTSGNLLVAVTGSLGGGTFTVTDSQANTWNQMVSADGGAGSTTGKVVLWWAVAKASGANTVTFGCGSASDPHLHILEISGNTASPADATGSALSANGGATQAVSSTAVSQANVCLVSAALNWGANSAFTVTPEALTDTSPNATGGDWMGDGVLFLTNASGAQTATWGGTSGQTCGLLIAAFKMAAAGSSVTVTASDSATAADSLSRSVLGLRTKTDALGFSEAVGRTTTFSRTIPDAFGFSDLASSASIVLVTLSVADSFSLQERITRSAAMARTLADATAVSDSVLRVRSSARVATDAIGVSDSTSRVLAAIRTLTDTRPTTEFLGRSVSSLARATDSVTVSELLSDILAVGNTRSVSDVFSSFDWVTSAVYTDWITDLPDTMLLDATANTAFPESIRRMAAITLLQRQAQNAQRPGLLCRLRHQALASLIRERSNGDPEFSRVVTDAGGWM